MRRIVLFKRKKLLKKKRSILGKNDGTKNIIRIDDGGVGMSRINKTIPNLRKVWDKLDSAYENIEAALEMLDSMSNIPDELKNEMERFDLSSITSLKQHVEMMMEEKY